MTTLRVSDSGLRTQGQLITVKEHTAESLQGLEETSSGLQSPPCVIAQDRLLLLPWTACHVPRVPGQGSPLESWGPGLLGVWSHGHVPPEGKLVTAMNHNVGANNPDKRAVRLGSGGWSSLRFSVNLSGGMPVSVVCFSPWAGPILRAQRDLFFMCRRSDLFPKFWLCHTYSFSNYPLFVQYKVINSDKQSGKGHQAMCFILIGSPFFSSLLNYSPSAWGFLWWAANNMPRCSQFYFLNKK